ncbi:hypothetical protein A4W95_00542 [Treponema pallidum subsp. pallidum]|nr:hypothetical protein A4W95_00542 [Treponema pallidum subsp. pallidum]
MHEECNFQGLTGMLAPRRGMCDNRPPGRASGGGESSVRTVSDGAPAHRGY